MCYNCIAFLANTVFPGVNNYFAVFSCLVFHGVITKITPQPPSQLSKVSFHVLRKVLRENVWPAPRAQCAAVD